MMQGKTSMRFSERVIDEAFKAHCRVYGKKWKVPEHIGWWRNATKAFDHGLFDEFSTLYGALRGNWQAFRGASGSSWDERRTFEALTGLDPAWRSRSLASLTDDDAQPCFELLQTMKEIKPLKSGGASVVAISKVLHFWNPRLFIIVDDGVMWRWVFSHGWLKRQVRSRHETIAPLIGRPGKKLATSPCDLHTYLAILHWGADVIRNNPEICPRFARHLERHKGKQPLDIPIDTYEAAALEWLLVGVVELPPKGVEVTWSRSEESKCDHCWPPQE